MAAVNQRAGDGRSAVGPSVLAMPSGPSGSLDDAVAIARGAAARRPTASASQCAVAAVRQVFGSRLIDEDGEVRADRQAEFWYIVNQVEGRLGIHRRSRERDGPMVPHLAAVPPTAVGVAAAAAAA